MIKPFAAPAIVNYDRFQTDRNVYR